MEVLRSSGTAEKTAKVTSSPVVGEIKENVIDKQCSSNRGQFLFSLQYLNKYLFPCSLSPATGCPII